MTSEDLALYLDGQFGPLARIADPDAVPYDALVYFSAAIDQALRALGTPEADLGTASVDDSLASDFIALGEYHALVLLERHLAAQVDTRIGQRDTKQSQAYAQVSTMRKEALISITQRGYGQDTAQAGRLVLDSLEPDLIAGGY